MVRGGYKCWFWLVYLGQCRDTYRCGVAFNKEVCLQTEDGRVSDSYVPSNASYHNFLVMGETMRGCTWEYVWFLYTVFISGYIIFLENWIKIREWDVS